MGSSRKKKILLLAGSTYVFIIGSILVFIGLILVMILLGYRDNESESSAGRAARLRPDLIIFDDPTPSPVADVVVASGQTAPPVTDTPVKTDAASSDTTTGNIQADTTAQPSTSPTLAPTPTTTTVVIPLSSATLTPTSTPTLTPTPTPTNSPTTTPTLTNTPSPTPVPGSIRGRILVNGVPAGGVTIKLEDQAINTIAQTVSNGNGGYTFANLTATSQGYNLVFAQEWNTQYQLQQVISWGWLGPITVADGTVAQIPDFDISLLGFEPTTPAANASFSAVSSSNPIQFKWASYPGATKYWVDLARGQGQNIVWQSSIAQGTSLSFDGTLSGGSQIQPGEYWWGVGARRDLGAYKLTVYGYLPVLLIVP